MIVSTPSAHHPQAEVTLADPQTGVIGYRWLDIDGNPVDSGGSIAYATPASPGEDGTYPDITADAILAAIANPPVAPVPVPLRVSRRGLFLALLEIDASLTRSAIRASLGSNEAALIEFDEAQFFERSHPLVAVLADALGFDDGDVDDVFRRADVI